MGHVPAAFLERSDQRTLRDRCRSVRRSTRELSALDHPFDCLARDAERSGGDAKVDVIVGFGRWIGRATWLGPYPMPHQLPATGSESSTTSASAGCASGSSHERSTSCSSGVDPDGPDVVRRERTGSGPYGRSADEGVCPAARGGVEGCIGSLSGFKCVGFGRIAGRDGTRRGRGGSRHGRDGTRHGRDGVATLSRRCLGDGPARRVIGRRPLRRRLARPPARGDG